jgi:hypothetical protein
MGLYSIELISYLKNNYSKRFSLLFGILISKYTGFQALNLQIYANSIVLNNLIDLSKEND